MSRCIGGTAERPLGTGTRQVSLSHQPLLGLGTPGFTPPPPHFVQTKAQVRPLTPPSLSRTEPPPEECAERRLSPVRPHRGCDLCLDENGGGQVMVRASSRDACSRVRLQVSVSSRIPARRAAMLEDGDAPPPGPCPALPGSSDHLLRNPSRFQLPGPTGNI